MTIEAATFTETQRAAWTKYNAVITDLTTAGIIDSSGTLTTYQQAKALADEGTISLPDASFGFLILSFDTDYLIANIAADGTVTMLIYKGEVAIANTDGQFCVYDSGTQAIVKNRTGASVNVALLYIYFTP